MLFLVINFNVIMCEEIANCCALGIIDAFVDRDAA